MNPKSLTIRFNGKAPALFTDVGIAKHFDHENEEPPEAIAYRGIWDTGATRTAITEKVVRECNLKPIGRATVTTAKGPRDCNTYLISLLLPQKVGITGITAFDSDLGGGIDVLIGMDIITSGDFAITSEDGKTCFSFSYPSTYDIDFIKLQNSKTKTPDFVAHRPKRPKKPKKKRR